MTFERLLALSCFMAPAYAANLAPPFVRFWKGWNPPLHRRLLGGHKTVVGVLAGLVAALLAAGILAALDLPWQLDTTRGWWLHGLLSGVGALGGDALKSLFKRRRGLPPGARWVPFDQLDFELGALVLAGPGAGLGPLDVTVVLAGGFLGSLLVNQVAYRIGVKETPW